MQMEQKDLENKGREKNIFINTSSASDKAHKEDSVAEWAMDGRCKLVILICLFACAFQNVMLWVYSVWFAIQILIYLLYLEVKTFLRVGKEVGKKSYPLIIKETVV